MGCKEPERDIIGVGVRLALYMQALAFFVLLWRGSISGSVSSAEQSMVVYLAILLAVVVQMSQRGDEGGWDYFSDAEVIMWSHLSTFYTALFSVARAAKEMVHWQVWSVNYFLRSEAKETRKNASHFRDTDESEVIAARKHNISFCALTLLPSAVVNIFFMVFWAFLYRSLRCSDSATTYGFFFYKVEAYGWIRYMHMLFTAVNFLGLVFAVVYLSRFSSFSEKLKSVTTASIRKGEFAAEHAIKQHSSIEKLMYGAATRYVRDTENWVKFARGWSLRLLLFSIIQATAVELTLHWNGLPMALTNAEEWADVKKFSQLFPLVVGACTLLQSLLPFEVTASEADITELLHCLDRPEGLFPKQKRKSLDGNQSVSLVSLGEQIPRVAHCSAAAGPAQSNLSGVHEVLVPYVHVPHSSRKNCERQKRKSQDGNRQPLSLVTLGEKIPDMAITMAAKDDM